MYVNSKYFYLYLLCNRVCENHVHFQKKKQIPKLKTLQHLLKQARRLNLKHYNRGILPMFKHA